MRTPLTLCLLFLGLSACSSGTTPNNGNGGSTAAGGDAARSGGGPGKGGSSNGGSSNGGSSNGGSANGGATASGGAATAGASASGGAGVAGGVSANGGSGTAGAGATAGAAGSPPVSYAWPPPSQCHNQDYIDYQAGCKKGDATSTCGGKCEVINACQESTAMKPGADVTFICPRVMLFSDAMLQAAIDDGNSDFNYGVVGHDVDRGGIDGNANSTCCQCYQLVYAYPSPKNERQVLADPDHPNPPTSAIPLPKPLIVQSFNTAATPTTFDVYMSAGGFGANNACAPGQQPAAASGQYLYTSYPTDGQSSQGGVKPVSLYTECKTQTQWVTTASLSSDACQSKVKAACEKIASDVPGLTAQSQRSCLQSNNPNSDYHMNWSVYVAKVECPEHLTQVTGCKLAPQGLPAVKKTVTTAAQAASDKDFWSKTSSGSDMYETTTMEDCCRPSCASKNWVSGKGLTTVGNYNAFYSCNAKGEPYLEKE